LLGCEQPKPPSVEIRVFNEASVPIADVEVNGSIIGDEFDAHTQQTSDHRGLCCMALHTSSLKVSWVVPDFERKKAKRITAVIQVGDIPADARYMTLYIHADHSLDIAFTAEPPTASHNAAEEGFGALVA
jgi:hypothetical protein